MTETQDRLNKIADFASSKGLQVTFRTRTEVEGSQAGRTVREITISAYDEPETDVEFVQIEGFKFVKVDGEDRWIARRQDGEQLFELSRQDYVSGDPGVEEDDWGIWDVAGGDWAHSPLETGFDKREDAVKSFERWLKENN